VKSRALAAYGELSYWFNDTFRAQLGLRVLDDTKDVSQETASQLSGASPLPIKLEEHFGAVTPKLLLDWEWRSGNRLTFDITNGAKPGGFPLSGACAATGQGSPACTPYGAEKVWQYQLNSKNEFFDERLRLNITLFWTDYDPYQICFIAAANFLCYSDGIATVRGLEVEWRFNPTPELVIDGNFNLLDARVDNFSIVDPVERRFDENSVLNPLFAFPQDLSGNRLPKAPKFNLNIGVQYDLRSGDLGLPDWGTFTGRIQYNYRSRTFYRVFNSAEYSQARYTKVDVRLSWRSNDDRWSIETFVNNVTDIDVINSLFLLPPNDGSVLAQYQGPRTAGVRIGFRY
jgi:iron complex outermembrane receptor protein